MGQLSYTTEQIDGAIKMCIEPTYFIMKATQHDPMVQLISELDTWQDVAFSGVEFEVGGDLEYDGDKVTYVGSTEMLMSMNLACILASDTNNTVVHIGQAQNEVVDDGAVSATKVESTTSLKSLNIASYFRMNNGDTLNLKIMSDKLATLSITHMQVVLKQIKA